MDVVNIIAMLEALKRKIFKYGKFEDLQAQEVVLVFIFILEYRNVVLSKGMQH